VSDHYHESYEIYGLDSYRADVREALSLASGLREDLSRAEQRIAELGETISEARLRIRDLAERVSDLESAREARP
jgi:predicted  nucleic acid-binding Zn-ribbon protein